MAQYRNDFDGKTLYWKHVLSSRKISEKQIYAQRRGAVQHKPFVMDELAHFMDREKGRACKEVDAVFQPIKFDDALAQPWNDALKRAEALRQAALTEGDTREIHTFMDRDIAAIRTHVEKAHVLWCKTVFPRRSTSGSNTTSGSCTESMRLSSFTGLPITQRQDILRASSRNFMSGPDALTFSKEEVSRLCASYAYVKYGDSNLSSEWRFPWNVAFNMLCSIGASGRPGGASVKTVSAELYSCLSVDRAARR